MPLAWGELGEQVLREHGILDPAELAVLGADGRGERFALAGSDGLVERHAAARARGLERLEDRLDGRVCGARQLLASGHAAELAGERVRLTFQAQHPLLQVAGRADRPGVVAEVALQLADHSRDGERAERHAAVRVEALDCLEQRNRGELHAVVMGDAAAAVARGNARGEPEIALDEQLLGRRVACRPIAQEQQALLMAVAQ